MQQSSWISKLIEFSEKHKTTTYIQALCLVIITGYVDYITGYKIGFSIFYLIPIALITWHLGRESGLIFSGVSILIWILADHFARAQAPDFLLLFWNALVRMGFFLIVVTILSRLKVSLEMEKRLARIDFLTGIANRHELQDVLFLEMERSRRHERPLTIAYLDCDNFKLVNDEKGHDQGDLLLKEVANVLAQNTRKVDKVARLGGDEFVIVLPETEEEKAREVLLRLHVKLLSVMELYRWPVTFSIGSVTFFDVPLTTRDAISEAEKLMYQAKQHGKNQLNSKSIRSLVKESRKRFDV